MARHRISVNGSINIARVPIPYLKVELFERGSSSLVQDHSIAQFRNPPQSSIVNWRVVFAKLRRRRVYYVVITLRRGGPDGTLVYQTYRAISTEDTNET